MTVYVDLDGVLANMEGYLHTHFGEHWKKEIEKPNWGKVSELHQRMYFELDPLADAHELWEWLTENFNDVQILTAIPKRAHFPNSVNDKRDWVHKHFGSHVKVNFGPFAYDKQFHCKPGDVLIDDMKPNITQWNDAGGVGILHKSADETISRMVFVKHVME